LAKNVRATLRRPGFVFLLLLALTVMIRASTFGQPLLHTDETFYLLVGDRWLHEGLWPYTDIWDRKPVGLFLIYAAIRELGGEGYLQYQLVACACVAGTAWLLSRFATRLADVRSGWLAAILYICWLPLYGGYGGQAPVFYNLMVIGAASLLLTLVIEQGPEPTDRKRHFFAGALAMLLMGGAMQIKTSAVFEGLLFGCALVWQIRRLDAGALIISAVGWIGIALLPTVMVAATYWARGDFDAYFFASVTSILARGGGFTASAGHRLAVLLGIAAPLLMATTFVFRTNMTLGAKFLIGWTGVALAAILVFGTYYLHYGLALLPPLSLAAALGISKTDISWRWIGSVMAALIVASTLHLGWKVMQRGTRTELDAVLAFLSPKSAGCPYFTGDSGPSLYLISGACLPSRFILSGHLFESHEAQAVGINQRRELERIIAARPPLITLQEQAGTEEDRAIRAFFFSKIQERYTLAARRRVGKSWLLIYRLSNPQRIQTDASRKDNALSSSLRSHPPSRRGPFRSV
jgi:hypothetical protein